MLRKERGYRPEPADVLKPKLKTVPVEDPDAVGSRWVTHKLENSVC